MNGGSQNQLGVDGAAGAIDIGNNQQHASLPSPNPQTPSSIPDILISSTLFSLENKSLELNGLFFVVPCNMLECINLISHLLM